jgi:hypothetical protein
MAREAIRAMARGRKNPLWALFLAALLTLLWGRLAHAADVMPSDNDSDVPSTYRYVMNGTELSVLGIDSISLVPLSASVWSLSPENFFVRDPTRI